MGRNNKRQGKDRKDRGFSNFDSFRSNYRPRGFSSEEREMHKATCSECGNECEVPFKPTEGRPVFCRTCYANHRPQRF
ncbi:hypothetical protein HYW21_01235 [Candidatus Woesearchaeota archaeon]|nr:hypothetical protein [Candidatus Woesearchaeota archaeon]